MIKTRINWKVAAVSGTLVGVGLGGFAFADANDPLVLPDGVVLEQPGSVASPDNPVSSTRPNPVNAPVPPSGAADGQDSPASPVSAASPVSVASVASPASVASVASPASVASVASPVSAPAPAAAASPPPVAADGQNSPASPVSTASPVSVASVGTS